MREIERKFLVADDSFRADIYSSKRIAQGYICSKRVTARVRIYGDQAFLTFKGKSRDGGLSRFEYERPIPMRCAELLLQRCKGRVEKIRHLACVADYTWEIDEFEGDNKGLIVAEVELSSVSERPQLPSWVWREVTRDYHYRNSYLAVRPYNSWFD